MSYEAFGWVAVIWFDYGKYILGIHLDFVQLIVILEPLIWYIQIWNIDV